eukprot:1642822-Pleurochrysis_carterae.AAC.1
MRTVRMIRGFVQRARELSEPQLQPTLDRARASRRPTGAATVPNAHGATASCARAYPCAPLAPAAAVPCACASTWPGCAVATRERPSAKQ